MAYSKRHFKQSKKLDNAKEFIKQKNYQRAIETIGQYQNESAYGRYLAGYSLMKLDRKPEAFSVWWPLFKAGSDAFKTDCQLLLQDVFSEPVWQVGQWRNLESKILADLLTAALHFSIETPSTRELEQYVIETFWNERQWELLSGILGIERTASYESLVLKAQLAFAAPRKSGLKPVPFAGLLMSAGASYLAVTPNSGDTGESGYLLKALANEIYNVYPIQQTGSRPVEQERMSLRLFLELERKTLEKILSLNPTRWMPYILSPGYFYHNDIPESYRSSLFDCLRKCGAETEIVDMYRREVFFQIHERNPRRWRTDNGRTFLSRDCC
ncbi:MAG: hypothetical protein IPK68_19495 [Bdellovibrionales bacterium]|nr:hypothetical protein [Bdellovibrionales bacterium]